MKNKITVSVVFLMLLLVIEDVNARQWEMNQHIMREVYKLLKIFSSGSISEMAASVGNLDVNSFSNNLFIKKLNYQNNGGLKNHMQTDYYSTNASINGIGKKWIYNRNYLIPAKDKSANFERDSTIIITNAMIQENIKLNIRSLERVIIKTFIASFYPIGYVITGLSVHNNFSREKSREYGPILAYGGSVYLPMAISFMYQLFKSEAAKSRIMRQYKGYKIVDQSTFLANFRKRYHFILGINYTKIITDNCEAKPGISFGFGRHWKLSKNFALNMDCLYEEYRCYIKDKIIRDEIDAPPPDSVSLSLSDISFYYKILNIPLTLNYNLFSLGDLSIKLLGGIGIAIQSTDNSKEMKKQEIVTVELSDIDSLKYDYYNSRPIIPQPYITFHCSFGFGMRFKKIETMFYFKSDINNSYKSVHNIVIRQPIENVNFTIRYYL